MLAHTPPPPPPAVACRGSDDDALLAYQIAFDLVDAELQAFMGKVGRRGVLVRPGVVEGREGWAGRLDAGVQALMGRGLGQLCGFCGVGGRQGRHGREVWAGVVWRAGEHAAAPPSPGAARGLSSPAACLPIVVDVNEVGLTCACR